MLPADLLTAEAEALAAVHQALASTPAGRWTVEFRFEGLRLLPVVLRLNGALQAAGLEPRLLFADMGATALARRDAGEAGGTIASFGDQERLQAQGPSDGLLLLVGAWGQLLRDHSPPAVHGAWAAIRRRRYRRGR